MPDYPPNVLGFRTITVVCQVANQAYPCLEHLKVPDGMSLVIKSHPINAIGTIVLVATNQAEAISANAWPLIPGETVSYQVTDAYNIWVSANVPGAIVVFTVEQ
jgi:hypothetical protein